MADGDHKECPIIPNTVVKAVADGGRELRYAAWVDVIHVFPDERYSHVKYWDEESSGFQYHFLGRSVLAQLSEAGIPFVQRPEITQSEYDAWAEYEAAVEVEGLQDEVDRFFDS